MDKKCSSCGVSVPASAKFCQNCGGSNFVENTPPQQPPQGNFNAGNQPGFAPNQYQQPYAYQGFQTPPVPPKKKKTGLVIGIVAAVLVVLGMIGAFAQNYLQSRGYDEDYDENNDYDLEDLLEEKEEVEEEKENVPAPIPYSKGTFDGSVYVNEWADIKLALPSGFSNGDASLYTSAENDVTDCGAYFVADDTMSLIYICYEKLPTYPIYTEEQYMDAVMKSLKSITSITYNTPSTYSQITISGYDYTKAVCSFNNGYGDFFNTVYVRKIDNYIVFISAAGVSPEANDALVSQITTAR